MVLKSWRGSFSSIPPRKGHSESVEGQGICDPHCHRGGGGRLHSDSAWYMGSGSFNSSRSKVTFPFPEHSTLTLAWGKGMNKVTVGFLLTLWWKAYICCLESDWMFTCKKCCWIWNRLALVGSGGIHLCQEHRGTVRSCWTGWWIVSHQSCHHGLTSN